jgi:hypothetical protein
VVGSELRDEEDLETAKFNSAGSVYSDHRKPAHGRYGDFKIIKVAGLLY